MTASCEWLKPATADSDGRFRFADLPRGRYTFQIKAPGFLPLDLEKIPAGTEGLRAMLNNAHPQ